MDEWAEENHSIVLEGKTKRELIIVFKCLESYSVGNADQLSSIFIQDRTKGDALNYMMEDFI